WLGLWQHAAVAGERLLLRRPRQRPSLVFRAVPELELGPALRRRKEHADARLQLRLEARRGPDPGVGHALGRAQHREVEADALDERGSFEELEGEASH